MARVESFRELVLRRKSMTLVSRIYRTTMTWPSEERFGLTMRARRAAVSIPATIAEGRGRSGSREMKPHLSIAHGSLSELDTRLLIGQDLGNSEATDIESLLAASNEISRMLRVMMTRMT